MGKVFHPWRHLRRLSHVTLLWADLPPGLQACTNGTDKIWMDYKLLQVERRCALTHEIVHLEMGHIGHQPINVELVVRAETAAKLIPIEKLLECQRWAHNSYELAEELWVTEDVLMDRLRTLTPAEQDLYNSVGNGIMVPAP